jgi:hypothetical protein
MRMTWKTLLYGPVGALCATILWIVLSEVRLGIREPLSATMALIRSNDKLVQNHVRAWGEAPESLNELRLFARQTASRYGAFDAWGERIEYLRLGKVNYTIRSFGADGVQNTPGAELDPGVFRWGPMEEHGLRYNLDDGAMQPRPSVVLFAGVDDGAGRWHAKLFVDPASGVKRLLVRRRNERDFFMLAPHDGVEEFLWVPGQDKIVFTASQSARYADGAYIWNLDSDEIINLLTIDAGASELDPGNKQQGFHVAMSAMRASNPPSVAVFAMPAREFLLDPSQFFHPAHLHVYTLGEKITHAAPNADAAKKPTLYDLSFLGTATISAGGEGSALQKAWLRLPMGGEWEKAVLSWQDFASRHGKTQLAPYAVWGLAMFYSDAAKRAGAGTKDGEIFTSYSVELGRALSNMVVAPGYARAIGAWMGAPR